MTSDRYITNMRIKMLDRRRRGSRQWGGSEYYFSALFRSCYQMNKYQAAVTHDRTILVSNKLNSKD